MSARATDGADAAYLEWHLLDHLPEQYRLPGLRLGQRWVSTPGCRAARAASAGDYDRVDHVVSYLFDDPFAPALNAFFDLGRALRHAGRMPMSLPSVDLAAYDLVERHAAPRIDISAEVVPWRPSVGAYLIVDGPAADPIALGALVEVDGVAGAWRWSGSDRHRPDRLASHPGVTLTVAYLDDDPEQVGPVMRDHLRQHWATTEAPASLAAPFWTVVPGDWATHLPHDPDAH